MTTRNEELSQLHDKGQTDASKGQHDPPHRDPGGIDRLIYGDRLIDELKEDNAAYESGQSHHESQTK